MLSDTVRDHLNAVAYWNRLLLLRIETDELLRKGSTRKNRKRQDRLLEEARVQIAGQMRVGRRHRFRNDVSIDISLHVLRHGSVASTQAGVKRYLDALNGLAYADDKQVAHLVIYRFADDWPRSTRRHRIAAEMKENAPQERPTARVDLMVSPIGVFSADWERAFRLGADLGYSQQDSLSESSDFERVWSQLTRENWTEVDDHRLDELFEEARDDRRGVGWIARLPPEMAEILRESHREELGELLQRRMLDELPDGQDHPLGSDPVFDLEFLDAVRLPNPYPRPRWNLPGHFWLPLSGSVASGWPELLREAMLKHRSDWPVLPAAFDRALALDIAAFGATPAGKDVDNLARRVLSLFEELYCAGRTGTVVIYRAYRRPSPEPGIRVLVMAADRMGLLLSAIDEARSAVLSGD